MALALLDGTTAAVDISLGGSSAKCLFNYVSADIGKQFTERTTFCTSGWRSRTPGMKQITGRLEGYLGKGSAISDPTQYAAEQAGVAIVITFDVGCTMTFTGHISRIHTGMRAAANSELSYDFESDGAPTFAWVVA